MDPRNCSVLSQLNIITVQNINNNTTIDEVVNSGTHNDDNNENFCDGCNRLEATNYTAD